MFSKGGGTHCDEGGGELLVGGTSRTSPPPQLLEGGWPKPWFFARLFLFVGVVYLGFSFATTEFNNINLIPGLIMMGSLAVPLATVFLFFALNTPRNIPLPRVLTFFWAGGLASLIVSLIGYAITSPGGLADLHPG